VAANH